MNSNDNSDAGILGFLGIIVLIVVVFGIVIKAVTELLNQISLFLIAFSHTANSFATASFEVAKIVFAVAGIVASVVGGIYVTYKYIVLVKNVVEIRKEINATQFHLRSYVEDAVTKMKDKVHAELSQFDERLTEALTVKESIPEQSEASSNLSISQSGSDEAQTSTAIPPTIQTQNTIQATNPY